MPEWGILIYSLNCSRIILNNNMRNKLRTFSVLLIVSFICNGNLIAQKASQAYLPSSALDWNTFKVEKTKTGERRQVLNSPTSTMENLEIHITTLNPGESAHLAHQHPEEELIIVKEGTVEVLAGGKSSVVGPGSVIFQAANQLHSIKNVGNVVAVYHAIKWKSKVQ